VEHARRRIAGAGLQHRVQCLQGDFTDPPAALAPADVAFAIESFAHGPDPRRFFEACRRLVRPGGVLVVCDDFLGSSAPAAGRAALARFRRGWRIHTLRTVADVVASAGTAGFRCDGVRSLTAHLALGRPRDHAIAAAAVLLRLAPPLARRFDHLVGGDALRTCLRQGWVDYTLVEFVG